MKKYLLSIFLVSQSLILISQNPNPSQIAKKTSIWGYNNLIEIGSRVGGYNMLFADYEYRYNGHLGLHATIGYPFGLIGGLKTHLSSTRRAPYFDLYYYNGGLNKIEQLGLDFCVNIFPPWQSFGIFLKAGVGKVLSIDNDYEKTEFPNGRNDFMLLMSAGINL